MATTITKTIGVTGRDYSTIQAFFTAVPADLVAVDELWEGVIYPDAGNEYTNQQLDLTVRTTSATCFVRLKAATGSSFTEHANKLTNALRPNAANGILLSAPSTQAAALLKTATRLELVGLQLDQRSTQGGSYATLLVGGSITTVRECLLQSLTHINANGTAGSSSLRAYNSVFVGTGIAMVGTTSQVALKGCTFAGNATATRAIKVDYNPAPLVKDCAMFGHTVANLSGGGYAAGSSNNATDLASWPSGLSGTLSLTYADQFESINISGGVHDFRLKSGNSIATAGVNDADILLDAVGTTRHATTPSVGAWEYAAAAATATTLSGPSSGTTGVASTSFTVGANGTITGTVTVTPGDAGNGGTFSPTTVAISSGTPTATFTYTPASTGVKTISITDDGGLTDATSLSYTSNAASSGYAPALFTMRSPSGVHFFGAHR